MAMMWMLIATVLFLIRPRSLRRSRADDKPGPSSRRDQDDGNQPGPSGSRDDAPGPSVSLINSRTAIAGAIIGLLLVFYNSKNLNCIGALSFYDSKRSIGEVLF